MSPTSRLILCSLLLSPAALADTHHVPQDHETIQAAIDAAASGDTILIHGGLYEEAVLIEDIDELILKAQGKVVIDPPGESVGITVDHSDDIELENLRVTGAGTGIVFDSCNNGALLKCRVEDISGKGIVLNACNNVFLEKCTIEDTAEDGLLIGDVEPSGSCIVVLCKLRRVGGSGIRINGNFNSIDTCLILEASGNGLTTNALPASMSNNIVAVKVVKPVDDGFRISGAENEVLACKVIQTSSHGAHIDEGVENSVTFCKFVKPADDGVYVEASAPDTIVGANKISKPAANGVRIEADDAVVLENKVTAAGADGYAVLGDTGSWTDNSATGSTSDGFELAGTNNTLTGNKAKGSKDGFDLNDLSGGTNTIDETNSFKTQFP